MTDTERPGDRPDYIIPANGKARTRDGRKVRKLRCRKDPFGETIIYGEARLGYRRDSLTWFSSGHYFLAKESDLDLMPATARSDTAAEPVCVHCGKTRKTHTRETNVCRGQAWKAVEPFTTFAPPPEPLIGQADDCSQDGRVGASDRAQHAAGGHMQSEASADLPEGWPSEGATIDEADRRRAGHSNTDVAFAVGFCEAWEWLTPFARRADPAPMSEVVVALADALEKIGEAYNIVQPILGVYRKHGLAISRERIRLAQIRAEKAKGEAELAKHKATVPGPRRIDELAADLAALAAAREASDA